MPSNLKDNRPTRGSVGEFLRSKIEPAADLSFVSAITPLFSGRDGMLPSAEENPTLGRRPRIGHLAGNCT